MHFFQFNALDVQLIDSKLNEQLSFFLNLFLSMHFLVFLNLIHNSSLFGFRFLLIFQTVFTQQPDKQILAFFKNICITWPASYKFKFYFKQ